MWCNLKCLITCSILLFCLGCANTLYEPHWSKNSRFIRSEEEIKTHILSVSSEPDGANVYVDDRLSGVTPCNISFTYKEKADYYQEFNEYKELIVFEGPKTTREVPLSDVYEKYRIPQKMNIHIKLYKDGYQPTDKDITIPDTKNVNGFLQQLSLTSRGSVQQQQQQQQQTVVISGNQSESASAAVGTVMVSSNVQGADIYVDNIFVGNAPVNLKLKDGIHIIEVKKAGYTDYRKELRVYSGSELSLLAELNKQ